MAGESQGFVSWADQYSVGIEIMDEQHRKLVEITNDLHKSQFVSHFEKSENTTKDELEGFINSLKAAVEYVKVHFSTEENLMRATNFPGYAAHKARHEEFARRVLQDLGRFNAGEKRVGMQFVYFLRDWLLEHIAVVDKDFALYAKSKGAK